LNKRSEKWSKMKKKMLGDAIVIRYPCVADVFSCREVAFCSYPVDMFHKAKFGSASAACI
jgi:hypothetical protein